MGDIHPLKCKSWVRLELRQARFFQRNVIVIIQVFRPQNGISTIQEPLRDRKTGKPIKPVPPVTRMTGSVITPPKTH